MVLQQSLLDVGEAAPSHGELQPRRHDLADGAWVEHQADWVDGADDLFELVLRWGAWDSYTMPMYGTVVRSPRLTAYSLIDDLPDSLAVIRDAAAALSARHRVPFVRVGCNLYRDGRDSVAWHGDQESGIVAIVSLGERRTFRLRPRGGGASLAWRLGRGDLMIMGGTCQSTWEHTVPKVAQAGPRISVTIRTDADS